MPPAAEGPARALALEVVRRGLLLPGLGLGLVLALVPAVARAVPFDGTVTDATGAPVANAHVSVNHAERATTALDGTFSLDAARLAAGDVVIVASPGLVSAFRQLAPTAPSTGLSIALDPLPADDATFTPELASRCSDCHGPYLRGWGRRGGSMSSAHSRSAVDAQVLDMFRGTASGRTDAAACGAAGGTFEMITNVGGFPVARCYLGAGLLPDANASCGHAGQPRCDDHAAPAASRPTSFGQCASCHAPGAAIRIPSEMDLDAAELDPGNTSVTCPVCHRIRAVLDPNLPGVLLGARVVRGIIAGDLALGLGQLDDSSSLRMPAAWSPLHGTSLLCAPCHQQTFRAPGMAARFADGVPAEQTYAEWLESPYSSGTREQSCQACHMHSLADLGVIPDTPDIGSGGPDRDPGLVHTHDFSPLTDAASLNRALTLTVDGHQDATALVVSASVHNRGVGHGFPSGETSRNVLFVVTAEIGGRALVEIGGEALPLYAGSYARGQVVSASGSTVVLDADVGADAVGRELRVWRELATWRDHQSFGVLRALPLAERGLRATEAVGRFTITAARGHEVDVDLAGVRPADLAGARWAVGDERHLAGRAGLGLAKVNVGADGSENVPFWRATDLRSDSRLAPDETQSCEHRFALPPGLDGDVTVSARLVYRKTFVDLADERGWTLEDLTAGMMTTAVAVSTPGVDAGVDAGSDAGAEDAASSASDAGADGGVAPTTDGGCGCSAPGDGRDTNRALLVLVALCALVAARSKRRR